MNFRTLQPIDSVQGQDKPVRRFQLSLKKHRNLHNVRKEDGSAACNKNFAIYDFPSAETFETDPTMCESQAFKLRLSDIMDGDSGNDQSLSEHGDGKTLREIQENKNSKSANVIEDSIVLVSDSSSGGTPGSTGRRKLYTSSLVRRSIGKRSKSPLQTIILDSSDSGDEDRQNLVKPRKSIISLSSENESPFDRLKFINCKPRLTDDISYTSDESSKGDIGKGSKTTLLSSTHISPNRQHISFGEKKFRVKGGVVNKSDGTRINGKANESENSSYSSTHYSLSPHQGDFHKHRTRNSSASSSNSDNNCKKLIPQNYESFVTPPLHRSTNKTNSSNETSDTNVSSKGTPNSATGTRNYNSARLIRSIKKLTSDDATNILKAIKLTSHPYFSPNVDKNRTNHESDKSSSHSYQLEDTESSENIVRIGKKAQVIAETESDSDDEIIRGSQTDLRPFKTHVSRFLDMPKQDQDYSHLSERKKKEISYWLMHNSPDSRNDSSCSNISESNRNTPSSGNSSLERFELQYETPNNRGKLSKPSPSTAERVTSRPKKDLAVQQNANPLPHTVTSGPSGDQILHKIVSRQSSLDRFLFKTKPSILKDHTPDRTNDLRNTKSCRDEHTPKNQPTMVRRDASIDSSSKKSNRPTAVNDAMSVESEKMSVMDCADILDNLYGDVWRANADAVFPRTAPRKSKAIKNNRETKTERKVNPKSMKNRKSNRDSAESEFDSFMKDIRPNLNSTKKQIKNSSWPRDSFINDGSVSEDSGGSIYHTALTNPRDSNDNRPPPKTAQVVSSTKRLEICDSETDEENDQNIINKDPNRRRLSFSDDESDTSTSEFDPGEVVLPKPKAKRGPTKIPHQTRKPTVVESSLFKSGFNDDKRLKSFLASLSDTIPMSNCHPDAKIYRKNYKNNREELCKYLFKLYNKQIFDNKLPNDLSIEWNVRMRGTAGFCYNKKSTKALGGITRSSRIVLATKILDKPDRVRDTLVHEMCHAAAWLINNVSDGHGPYWKGWASKAMQTFPELPPIKRCHDYKIATKFTYKCTSCGYSIGRHSKSLDIERKRCGHCYGKFELLINRTTKSGTVQVATPVQSKTPSGFALFVKENYHSVKKNRRSIKHGEVMKILGQQFSAVKLGKKNDHV